MSSGLPILTYHSLDPSGSVISTDPRWFDATMRTLREDGYRTVDLADWIAQGRPKVDRGFAITFDDGLRSICRAQQILGELSFSATIFVVTDHVGGDNAWDAPWRSIPRSSTLCWSQIKDLVAAGFSIGAHTRTHPRLGRRDFDLWDDELRGSREIIENRLARPCPLFAYPYGIAPRRVRGRAASLFEACLGTRSALCSARHPQENLPRIDAYDLRTPARLQLLLTGELEARLRARWFARRCRQAAASPLRALVAPLQSSPTRRSKEVELGELAAA
jgi:peptidoglycan/xylan/chitin deacetylase (PgdA/CDA1 family)